MGDEKRTTTLTPEQQKEALKKIDDLWKKDEFGRRKCEVCEASNWTISGDLITPVVLSAGGGMTIGGTTYPQIQVICTNCGNTKYFNAVLLKMAPGKGEEDV